MLILKCTSGFLSDAILRSGGRAITRPQLRSFPVRIVSSILKSLANVLTSEKYVVTTVRSANFLPARARRAFPADSGVSNLTKILPTPFDCLLPPVGRGTFMSSTLPYFSHSSFTSSQISKIWSAWIVQCGGGSTYLHSLRCQ